MGRAIRLFISYSSEDADLKDRFLKAIGAMIDSGEVDPWHDRKIKAGEEWNQEIIDRIGWADVALLLISENFISSNFITKKELPLMERKRQAGNYLVIPVLLDRCFYMPNKFLFSLQLLNKNNTPISEDNNPSAAWADIAERLYENLQELDLRPLTPIFPPLTLPHLLQHLPDTSPRLFGREKEIDLLDKVSRDKGVLVWVAGGGTGKSALVRHWLLNSDLPEETRFLGYSFYKQGTQDQNTTSAHFLREALLQLGCTDTDIPLDNFEQGQKLAELARIKPTVLVLDGVEPLQHPLKGHHQLGGLFKDQGLVGLLTELAQQPGKAICLVSSRVPLKDTGLQQCQQHNLNHLSPEAAIQLLKHRGVNGLQEDLTKAAKRYQHHALALVLVSEYLKEFHHGQVEKAFEIPLLSEKTKSGRHAKSVMRAYDIALKKAGEGLDREMVRLLGLFDRPAEWAALEDLKKADPIPGLTKEFHPATPQQVAESLARLRQWGLLNPGGQDEPLDAHPLVREWFGEALSQELPDSFRQAHAVLFRHYQQVPDKEQPDTLAELEPLYRAVRHGCLAGAYQEAREKVYRDRIQRGAQAYSLKTLGAHSSDLSALAGFFPAGFAHMPVIDLSEEAQGWLLAVASFLLMSLGRLTEAVGPRKTGITMCERMKDWHNATISAENLTDLLLPLGRLAEAAEAAHQGLDFAARMAEGEEKPLHRMLCHAYQGQTAHCLGRMTAAASDFQQAEALQRQRQLHLPQLYSLSGTHYALFLLERAATPEDRDAVLVRGGYIGKQNTHMPKEIAFGQLVLGLASESLGQSQKAASHLQAAVAAMRRSGMNNWLPWFLLAHAGVLHRQGDDLTQAKKHLAEARERAERGEMGLYLAECALLAGEIALDEGRKEDAEKEHHRAKTLITEMGYLRRQGEVLLLEARLTGSQEIFAKARQQFQDLGQFGLLERYKSLFT